MRGLKRGRSLASSIEPLPSAFWILRCIECFGLSSTTTASAQRPVTWAGPLPGTAPSDAPSAAEDMLPEASDELLESESESLESSSELLLETSDLPESLEESCFFTSFGGAGC